MTYEKIKKWLPYVTSALVAVTAAAFIISAVLILASDTPRPYSREIVGEYLGYLSIPSVLTLISVVLGLVFYRGESDALTKTSLVKVTLNRLSERLNLEECDEDTRAAIYREQTSRRVCAFMLGFITFAVTLVSVLYVTVVAKFTKEDPNGSVASAMLVVLPLVAVAMGCAVIALYRFADSYKQQLKITKAAIAGGSVYGEAFQREKHPVALFFEKHQKKITLGVRIALLALSLTFIVLGIINGGAADVIGKAIRICTECIGLG